MKKGDVVIVCDSSYSRVIKDNKLTCGPDDDRYTWENNRKKYVIIEIGCSFPNTGAPNSFNNTVIRAIDSGEVVFIEKRFLCLATLIREVTMAEVCTQFGEDVKIKKD